MDRAAVAAAVRGLRQGRAGARLAALAPECRPADEASAYAVQRAMAEGVAIGGWKVGAAGPTAPCFCAPLPLAGIAASPAELPPGVMRGVEAEVAFRLGHDLP